MFGLNRKPSVPIPASAPSIRDTLFGDGPIEQWPPANSAGASLEPWKSFVSARDALAGGRQAEAVALWKQIVGTTGLESRHYLQAWHFLRQQGEQPPREDAKKLLGVVLEVSVEGGLDLLAAYPERTARYYNYSGAGVVWERPDASLDGPIAALLAASQPVLDAIGPWDKPRPPAPSAGNVRLNFLSPAGLHFGQGPFQVLANEPMGKPVIDAGTALMQQLIAYGGRPGR